MHHKAEKVQEVQLVDFVEVPAVASAYEVAQFLDRGKVVAAKNTCFHLDLLAAADSLTLVADVRLV